MEGIFRVYDRFPRMGLRERIGQQDMSLDITDAYVNGRNAMIEAGVGIGKSFGYLIPSLLINQVSQQPIIITTSSIQLSEQIHKDLRVIGSRLGFTTVRSVVGGDSMLAETGLQSCSSQMIQIPQYPPLPSE